MKNPEAGDVIEGTGGLRNVRFVDEQRNKGKHEQDDLTPQHKKALEHMLDRETKARTHHET